MERIVFLDLEETIIVSWQNRTPCNIEKVKNTLRMLEVKEVHIFSFAIDNNNDAATFANVDFKDWLETILEIEIKTFPTVEEIMKVCFKHTGNHFLMFEFKSMWGKVRAFQDFCNAKFKNCECFLLDDVVQNTTFLNHDTNLSINTIKI